MEWAYGVTTVPERKLSHLPRTLRTLSSAGFPLPHLFIDGAYDHELSKLGLCCFRGSRIGVVGNWALAMVELYLRNPHANRYALFQDDIIASRGIKEYVERSYEAPDRTYLNLYTSPSNEGISSSIGWYESRLVNTNGTSRKQIGRGALGLVFSNIALLALLSSPMFVRKPQDPGNGTTNLDGAVVNALNAQGFRELVHNPSLLQHGGDVSTIEKERKIKTRGGIRWRKDKKRWGADALSSTFKGEEFDACSL